MDLLIFFQVNSVGFTCLLEMVFRRYVMVAKESGLDLSRN
jgi:hypothetical protein